MEQMEQLDQGMVGAFPVKQQETTNIHSKMSKFWQILQCLPLPAQALGFQGNDCFRYRVITVILKNNANEK